MNEISREWHDRFVATPITDGIILNRDVWVADEQPRQIVLTNVPHLVCHHSPSGFEWGYAGSGPADLALNILEWVLQETGYEGRRVQCFQGECFALAFELHQTFKWQIIARVPHQGKTIPFESVRLWVERQKGVEVDG